MNDVARRGSGRSTRSARVAVALLLLPGALLTLPAAAQTYPAAPVAPNDADRLADAVRRLGASPRNLSALIEAGELSFRLGDATAAAALYKRAEAIDPANARVKAGIARILVNGERPGEALRYFDLAQRYGAPMARYGDDRGLAYDLIGQQDRAQRDYRAALAQNGQEGDVDEIRRRYALSLGISGRRDEALAEIDTLLRRSDRGAWRARAFILAMSGDVAGANRIATSMMPGMAAGLAGFFQRLPTLGAVDRAFAVHFGEVAPTPQRIADARLVPALPALGADPTAPRPVEVVAVAPVFPAPRDRRTARRDGRSERNNRTAIAATPVVTATRAAPSVVAPVAAPAVSVPAATPAMTAARAPTTSPAAAGPVIVGRPTGAGIVPVQTPVATPAPVRTAGVTAPVATPSPTTSASAMNSAAAPPIPQPARATTTAIAAAAQPASTIPGVVPAVTTTAPAQPNPVVVASAPAIAPAVRQTTQPANPAPARATPPRVTEDSILARIVAGITIPASELGVAPMPGAEPAPATGAVAPAGASLDEAARIAERNAAADEEKRQRLVARRLATEKLVADRKAKEAAEKKAKDLADRKAAAAALAEERRIARLEPARIWVQVAGGASEGDLARAWKATQGKTAALVGRRGYTTPLRATNRVLTGPFKTTAEARDFVNTLAKQGVSAFTFTSEQGQKITPLGSK